MIRRRLPDGGRRRRHNCAVYCSTVLRVSPSALKPARHLLARSRERGRVENRARARLGLPPLALDDELIARIEAAGGEERALTLLARLPDDQRQALEARVLDERGYDEIAAELQCSETVIRKRVSRGLAALRTRLGATR